MTRSGDFRISRMPPSGCRSIGTPHPAPWSSSPASRRASWRRYSRSTESCIGLGGPHARSLKRVTPAGSRPRTTLPKPSDAAGLTHPRHLSQAFQAVRFAVNEELGSLDRGLLAASRVLPPSGRLVVIAFESLTDRRVKHAFRPVRERRPHPGLPEPLPRWRVLTSKAVRPRPEEIARNPRARSARLRAAERTTHA